MQKKINSGMMLIVFTSVTLLALLLSLVFYNLLADSVKTALRENGYNVRQTLNIANDKLEIVPVVTNPKSDVRYTLIAKDGTVLYDDRYDLSLMPNHSDREEFIEAQETGEGECNRHSDTLREESFYVAYLLNDGSVIRLSQTSKNIFGVFSAALAGTAAVASAVIVLSAILAKRITNRIIVPINNIDMDTDEIAIYDELAMFQRTITNYRRQVKLKIAETEQKSELMNAIIGNIKEGIILLNRQGIVITANKSALKLLGCEGDAIGRTILELTRESDMLKNTNDALHGNSCDMQFAYNSKNYQVFFSPSPENGVIVLFLDVSDRTAAEKLRKEFTANVSHELKTPLTSISGYAEMMADGIAKPSDYILFAKKIKTEAGRLILLVDDILLLSRLDEDNYNIESNEINIRDVSENVKNALSAKADACGVLLNTEGGAVLKANANLMYELIYNLVDNGIKYNRPGGEVTVRISNAENRTVITVSDTGIGIPKEHQNRVFERFYRVDKSRAKKTGGTGLGLSIVKHIAMIYGGTVYVESEPGKGTKITIIF